VGDSEKEVSQCLFRSFKESSQLGDIVEEEKSHEHIMIQPLINGSWEVWREWDSD